VELLDDDIFGPYAVSISGRRPGKYEQVKGIFSNENSMVGHYAAAA
jgi:hypothetical protein